MNTSGLFINLTVVHTCPICQEKYENKLLMTTICSSCENL